MAVLDHGVYNSCNLTIKMVNTKNYEIVSQMDFHMEKNGFI